MPCVNKKGPRDDEQDQEPPLPRFVLTVPDRAHTITLRLPRGTKGILRVKVDPFIMNQVCPRWNEIRIQQRQEAGGVTWVGDVKFYHRDAYCAFEVMIEIIHGHFQLDPDRTNPKVFFYMSEVYDWLGRPPFVYAHDARRPQIHDGTAEKFSCPPRGLILNHVRTLIGEAGSLRNVQDWVLLAVVAKKFNLGLLQYWVRDNLSVLCTSNQRILPEGTHESLNLIQRNAVKRLNLMDQSVLDRRQYFLDQIFKGIRILVERLTYCEAGLWPSPGLSAFYKEYWVDGCPNCLPPPLGVLVKALLKAQLWPPRAMSFQKRVVDLVQVLKDMGHQIRHGEDTGEASCNHLMHLCERLPEL
ncbi:hypothetical protein FZEAL_3118 [Fusarium zealandicum]|uniref:Uncharacterized protein n=1 Tax=Fusarium zealandicum TaxID=1053134 RepID=A0A8H4UPE4_9HYPO|nr:hypothetical protein FZEAL_3118 [Fusarium zealandicum]